MRYAVTGGAGFVGSRLSRLLADRGHEVIIIDNMCRGIEGSAAGMGDGVSVCRADITDMDALSKAAAGADGVFHQAALTFVPESYSKADEYIGVNVGGTRNVFELARKMGIRTVYASSSSVYGDAGASPVREDAQRRPANPYGKTKLECEYLAEEFHSGGQSIIGLRYFNVYGPGESGDRAGVVTKFLSAIGAGLRPTIFGDGSRVRDFVHVDDVARANLAAMEARAEYALVNVGTGTATSILDLAQTMIRLSGRNLEPEFSGDLDGDVRGSRADTSLARDLLGWQHEIGLERGLGAFFC